eukprot:3430919-Prymnesium_polylepis.1
MSAKQNLQARQLGRARPRHARRCERVGYGRQHDELLVQGHTRRVLTNDGLAETVEHLSAIFERPAAGVALD